MFRPLPALVLAAAVVTPAFAQDTPAPPAEKPAGKEHAWLKQFVGEWETKAEAKMSPEAAPLEFKGSDKGRAVGDHWIVMELTSEFAGTSMTGILTLGYDSESKKYIGTWIDSASDHLWTYVGTLDDTGKILTLEAEGPNPLEPGKIGKFRDIHEFKDENTRLSRSQALGDDGKWVTFIEGEAKRKK